MKIEFTKGKWEDFFIYAYSQRFPFAPKFKQEEDCIVNGRNPEMSDGFDYITIFAKEKYGVGTKLSAVCSFEEYGAPLITITDELTEDEEGNLKYRNYYEAVVWEEGLNVWKLYEEDGVMKWHMVMAVKFKLESNKKHEIRTEVVEKGWNIEIDGIKSYVRIEDLPTEFYIGITGCENINRFYSMEIEK